MAGIVVVVLLATAGVVVAWHRRRPPVPIGEGIRALGRIGGHDTVPQMTARPHRAARRRQQVRLASSLCLAALAVAWIASSYRRGWAILLAFMLLLRVLFELLARRHPSIS